MPRRRKKLIEEALSLEAINKESAREKSIHHGHPSMLHFGREPVVGISSVIYKLAGPMTKGEPSQ